MKTKKHFKIAILGDTHFGARGDSLAFMDYFLKFYDDVFFPYILENNIKTIVQLGDLFDRRKFINFNILHLTRTRFFKKIEEYGLTFHTLLGNHDIAFKNTLMVNSTSMLLRDFNNVIPYDNFSTIDFNNVKFDIIPWICEENHDEIVEKIKQSDSKYCFAHLEINGFEMDRGNVYKGEGLDKQLLSKYNKVLTGHFHHKSDDGHIFYLGTPYELTWSDYADPRGFHVMDLQDESIEFIRNPYQMFHKIVYDDSKQDKKYWNGFDFEKYKNTNLKLIVSDKNDVMMYDTVLEKFDAVGVNDIDVIDSQEILSENESEDVVDETQDTLTILMKHVDDESPKEKEFVKTTLREIYIESMSMERTQ